MFALCLQTINRHVRICFSRAAARSRNQTQKLIRRIRLTKTQQQVFLHTEIKAEQLTTAVTNSSAHGRPPRPRKKKFLVNFGDITHIKPMSKMYVSQT